MIVTLNRVILCASALIALGGVSPVIAQQPTDAQRNAVRANCRSDYQSHCSSVPPGGLPSLQCLQKNATSLSPSCRLAVDALEPPPGSAKADTIPATSAPLPVEIAKPAPAISPTPEVPKSPASKDAPPKTAATPPSQKPTANVNPPRVNGPKGTATANPVDVPAAATSTVLVLRPMLPREELYVARSPCAGDIRVLCGNVPVGGGRIMQCLAAQAAALSPACKEILTQFAVQ